MKIEQLQHVSMLSKLDTAVWDKNFAENQVSACHYSKGVTIHQQHEACATLDIVLSGNLVAYSLSENGCTVTMFDFKEHSVIGANLLFANNNAYPLNIYSVTACTLLHLTRDAVLDFLHDYHFVIEYIKSLSFNSQGMNRKITMLTQKTLRENILDYFLQQSVVQGSSKIVLPFSKKEFADYLGVQRPSLFRELKRLKDDGIIKIDNRTILLISQVGV